MTESKTGRRPARTAHDAALRIMRELHDADHRAYFAGGCVRDMLLGLSPKDYDVVTDAIPERVAALFPGARKVGAQFGVMLVRKYGFDIEVATFRSDGAYSDGRHPDAVVFGSEREDAQRRDFTINGMFHDPVGDRVIDYVEGRRDLDLRVIRTVGPPARRFAEDHLRMLRAVRFAARLGFSVEEDTLAAIQLHASQLGRVSAERVCMELTEILTAPSRSLGWSLLLSSGLGPYLADGWEPGGKADRLVERRLALLPPHPIDQPLAFAAVLYALSAESWARVCRTLRMSNVAVAGVDWLLRSIPSALRPDDLELADVKLLMANERWSSLLCLLSAELQASNRSQTPYDVLCSRAAGVRPEEITPPPLVDGNDLMDLDLPPGPQMGRILDTLYRAQLNEHVISRQDAMRLVRDLIEQG